MELGDGSGCDEMCFFKEIFMRMKMVRTFLPWLVLFCLLPLACPSKSAAAGNSVRFLDGKNCGSGDGANQLCAGHQ